MKKKTAVVTGGGTGIGRALAHRLAALGLRVLIVGRRKEPLDETAAAFPDHIEPVVADISIPQGRRTVSKAIGFNKPLHLLVQNAGLLRPVSKLEKVILTDWRDSMAINVEAPLFLTQSLLEHMPEGARILHISSGAAHNAYHGWGAYCVSKAALHMLYRCLDQELAPRKIRVGSARPGVVDTPMQNEVRSSDPAAFPERDRFVSFKENGELVDPKDTAKFLSWLLLDVEAERFAAEEWDFRDEDMHGGAWR